MHGRFSDPYFKVLWQGGKTKFLDFFFIGASATKRFARSRIFKYGCLMIFLSNREKEGIGRSVQRPPPPPPWFKGLNNYPGTRRSDNLRIYRLLLNTDPIYWTVTVYPRSIYPFYIVSYCVKWVTTSCATQGFYISFNSLFGSKSIKRWGRKSYWFPCKYLQSILVSRVFSFKYSESFIR